MLINGQSDMHMTNLAHPLMGQLNSLSQMQLGHYASIGTIGHRGSLSTHNTLSRHANGSVSHSNGPMISNYATISRAAHGQMMNGGGAILTNGGTLISSMGNGSLLPNGVSSNHIYGSSPYLQTQSQRPQSLYHPATHFVGLEVGLEMVDHPGCCFANIRRCNISRVIAFVCGMIVVFLMTLCIASSSWLTADKYRQGLWEFCVDEGAAMPLPFDLDVHPGCYPGRDVSYIRLAGILCSFGLVFDFFATVMTGFGLCSNNPHRKYTLYRFALYVMIASLIVILTALVIYPAYFASEIEISNRQVWEFGWAYGVGWGASIFLFGAILLLLCDKETEEIYYKERTIVHNSHVNEMKA